jgi:hypothetical protein
MDYSARTRRRRGSRVTDIGAKIGAGAAESSLRAQRIGRRSATVQFSVVGANGRTIAFPAVHVQFAPLTVYKSDVL